MSQLYLTYGSYAHDLSEAAVSISRQGRFSEHGQLVSTVERWEITGTLHASDQATLFSAIASLNHFYSLQGQDVVLRFEGGTATNHALLSGDCVGGVRVVEGPSFPEGRGAEYSTFRTYRIVVEGELPALGNALLHYYETLTFEGGGPRWILLQTLNGLPQRQQVAQATPFRVTQQGEAVGYLSRPLPNSPIWPQAEHTDLRRIEYPRPKSTGPRGQTAYTEFPVRWSYYFESATPLVGSSMSRI
jgi:hypothetical protein